VIGEKIEDLKKEKIRMENRIFNKNRLISIFSKIIKTGDFTLSSGLKSDFYINCKEILLEHQCMVTVSKCVWDILLKLHQTNVCSVAGITIGADPIVCTMVAFYWRNGLFIRKKEKIHGTKKLIEGNFKKDETVVIVDDVLTTGSSIKYAYDVLIESNLNPISVIVLVDRQENRAAEMLENNLNIPIRSIITKKELLQYMKR